MGRKYSINGARAVATTAKTVVILTGGTTIRPMIADIIFGASGTPADNALIWTVARATTGGTVTAVTPLATDPGDPAALATAGSNATAEPTYTAGGSLLVIDSNQRSTQRWVANPGYELKIPATAANGIGETTLHASYTGNVDSTMLYEE